MLPKAWLFLLRPMLLALGMLLAFIGASSGNTQSIRSTPGLGGLAIYKYTPLNMSQIHCVVFFCSHEAHRSNNTKRVVTRVFAFIMLLCACVRGTQSTRYQAGHRYSKSRHNLRTPAVYLQHPGFMRICFTCTNTSLSSESRMCS